MYESSVVVERLRAEMDAGRAIFCARCASATAARYAEEGGADLIVTYALARWHQAGYMAGGGIAPIADGNALAFEVGRREILPIVRDTPVLLGLRAPIRRGASTTRQYKHALK